MDAITTAVYEPPEKGLPLVVVVFFPQQDSLLCRPAWSRAEADDLVAKIRKEIGLDLGEHGTA